MQFIKTDLPDLIIIEPKINGDSRGYFIESYKKAVFDKNIEKTEFIQDNESKSSYGVLRGMHLQKPPYTQAKLVRVIEGEVLDVVIDCRTDSSTFGKTFNIKLSAENKKQMFVPRGFAHGFVVLSESAIFSYKVDNHYSQENEIGVLYNDSYLQIDWVVNPKQLLLSSKDKLLPFFKEQQFYNKQDYFKNV